MVCRLRAEEFESPSVPNFGASFSLDTDEKRTEIAFMPILNYTTKIPSEKTVNEIQRILGRCKVVTAVRTDYAKGQPSALLFAIVIQGTEVHFRLPCNAEGVAQAMQRQGVSGRYWENAEAVAWRIVKDWVEAQLALVDAGQAQMAEVFLPYAIIGGKTMFECFELQAARGLITAGEGVT